MAQKLGKAKYWTAVLYPESMVDNWQDKISDLLQFPFCYCVHDRDLSGKRIKTVKNKFNKNVTYEVIENPEELRKVHIHVVIAFTNTTTYKHALSVFQRLEPNITYCEQVLNIRYIYDYLIHNTDTAKKQGKFLYDVNDRICGNNFDIGAYEQISITDKRNMCNELCDFIVSNCITNFVDFYSSSLDKFGSEYFEVICTYSGLMERLCKGNYLKMLKEYSK